MTGWERSRAAASVFDWRETSGSTNADLLAAAARLPHLAVIATDTQTAGRGRLDRVWTAPPGSSLAISVLLRPRLSTGAALPAEHWGWIALMTGLAMRETVADILPGIAPDVKWPNDLLIDGRKLCGILAEVAADSSIVVGIGLNTAMTAEQLPVETATSLAIEGAVVDEDLLDRLLAGFLMRLSARMNALLDAEGDADASGLRGAVEAACVTLGRDVRVELPGAEPLHGVATGIDEGGRILVTRADGRVAAVSAGDVVHLRYE